MARHDRIFWLLCLSILGNYGAQGLLYPALPLYLTEELEASKAMVGLVVALLSVVSIAVRPWAGAFVDKRGRRPLILVGPAMVAFSGVALLASASIQLVIAARIIQGIGGSLLYTGAATMVADLAPPGKRPRYIARFGMFFYVGFAAGPWAAEALIAASGYRAVWWAVVGLALAGAVVGLVLPETMPVIDTNEPPPPPLSIMRRLFHPDAIAPGLVFLTVSVGWTALSAFLALYARDIGLDSSERLFLVLSLTVLATRAFAGSLAERFGVAPIVVPGLGAIVTGLMVLAVFRSAGWAYLGLVLFGVGFSGLFPVLFSVVADRAPDRERGAAMSSFNVFFDLGSPIGGYGVGVLIGLGGYTLGFGACAAIALVGGLALRWMLRPAVPVTGPEPAV